MSWLPRRAPATSDGSAAFAIELATVVDRAFPIDEAAIGRVRGAALGAFIEATPTPGRHVTGRPVGRRVALGLVASIALLGLSTVAVQARPGTPFYPVRLAIETATLPSVEAPQGWQARLDRLQRRIKESLAAEQRSDPDGVAAALGEYRSELAGMTAGLVDPGRRSELTAVLTRDLPVVLDIERTDPSQTASRLVEEIRAFLGSTDQADPTDGRGSPSDPRDGTTGNPHADGTTADPHDDGATGNPHTDGTTGDPHDDGSTGNPHPDGTTGDPHDDGATGNPHDDGATGNPHDDGKKPANPSGDKKPAKPHAGGKGSGSAHRGAK